MDSFLQCIRITESNRMNVGVVSFARSPDQDIVYSGRDLRNGEGTINAICASYCTSSSFDNTWMPKI
jgi:hypothetical protein